MFTYSGFARLSMTVLVSLSLNPVLVEVRGLDRADNRRLTVLDQPRSTVLHSFGVLPLTFDLNRGQTDREVQFVSRSHRSTVFLTSTETVFALNSSRSPNPQRGLKGKAQESRLVGPEVVRMKFVGGNPQRFVGLDEQPQTSNYLIGSDPHRWRTHVPTYARLASKGLYPGIDLRYHGTQGQLEYDLIVAPGATLDSVEIAFTGIQTFWIDAAGDLILQTGRGMLRQAKPVAYQEIKGKRRSVASSYVRKGVREVGFRVGRYNRQEPLVIDPVLSYSTYLGGLRDEHAFAIAVDKQGNAYVTGQTGSVNFPTANPIQQMKAGEFPECFVCTDAFVAKLNRTGSALVYSTYLGGGEDEDGETITVDKDGNAYVAGLTSSRDFPMANAMQPAHGGATSERGDPEAQSQRLRAHLFNLPGWQPERWSGWDRRR